MQKRFNVILLLKTTPNTPILEAYQSSLLLTYRELQENTIIPDYTTLISITTIDNPDQDGIHILTFLKNDPEHFDDDDTASITCIECLRDTFAYDPEACFGQAPIITEFNSFFTVSIPYNY